MMQIFVPFADVNVNAKILDEHTLNKQCASAAAIIDVLSQDVNNGWGWNPAIKMWKGNEAFLGHYAHRLFAEWKSLGFPDLWSTRVIARGFIKTPSTTVYPWWWGHEQLHDYNKVALYRQNPEWYGQFFKDLDLNAIGWWPVNGSQFMRGPKTLTGTFTILEHPVFDGVRQMSDEDFIVHANQYHRLTPDMPGGVRSNEQPQMLGLLRTLHDRFHAQRVYLSHDHR